MHEQFKLPLTAYHLFVVNMLMSVFDNLNELVPLFYWVDCRFNSQPSLIKNYYFVLLSEFWEWQSDLLFVECSRYFDDSSMLTLQFSQSNVVPPYFVHASLRLHPEDSSLYRVSPFINPLKPQAPLLQNVSLFPHTHKGQYFIPHLH